VQARAEFDVAVDGMPDGFHRRVLHRQRLQSSAALPHAEHRRFADRTAPEVQALIHVLVPFLAADIGFVNLDDAAQFAQVFPARLPEAMQQEPRGLLGDTDFLRQLQAGHALASGDEQIHGVEPLVERDVRPLHHGASADREILIALVAPVVATLPSGDAFAQPTDGAANAVRPESRFEVEPSGLRIRKPLVKVERADRRLGCIGFGHLRHPRPFAGFRVGGKPAGRAVSPTTVEPRSGLTDGNRYMGSRLEGRREAIETRTRPLGLRLAAFANRIRVNHEQNSTPNRQGSQEYKSLRFLLSDTADR
jgi:hypothetical protein